MNETILSQYDELKAKHPDALLLFRSGNFYTALHDDAVAAADILHLVVTKKRTEGKTYVRTCSFPHTSLDAYLPRLVRAGRRIAICEQLEDRRPAKGVDK